MSTSDIVHQIRLQLWDITFSRYLADELLSPQWWVIVITLLITYVTWWKLLNKKRILEIMLFGSYMAVMSTFIDIWGVSSAHWQYNLRLFPVSPAPFPFDFTLVPIIFMLIYQYTKTLSSYLLFSTLGAAMFSFLISPLLQKFNIVSYYNDWKFTYFFVIIMIISAFARYAIQLTLKISATQQAENYNSYFVVVQPTAKPLPEDIDNKEKDK